MAVIYGKVKVDYKTKNLVKRVQPHDIAVINHADLDEVAALSLVKARVKAVINAQPSATGRYPNQGPGVLVKHHIPLIDNAGAAVMNLRDGQAIEIRGGEVIAENVVLARGIRQSHETVLKVMEYGMTNLQRSMEKFVDNTLFHAGLERDLILGEMRIPALNTQLRGKQALIVVRGASYYEDLAAVSSYVREMRPVLIGVDGGADALYECGYRPDLIFGDMDSVSDEVLSCGAELVVHAYADGISPGLARIRKMRLDAKVFAAPGTSEDAAMLLAYHSGAELLVAVGAHSNIVDFLEKGRNGMASTVLTRIKVGNILIDAKGVSKLYGRQAGIRPVPVFRLLAP